MNRRGFLKKLLAAAVAGPAVFLAPKVPFLPPKPPPQTIRWVYGTVTLTARKLPMLVSVPNELFTLYEATGEIMIREEMTKRIATELNAVEDCWR